MTSPLHNPIFDAKTTSFLTNLRDSIMRRLPLEDLPPAVRREVRQRLEQALADLALAGQRDPGQLERYARSQVGPLIAAGNPGGPWE